jgi:uncharacterized protein (TIGR00251 family)
MRIYLKVNPRSSQQSVEKMVDGNYKINLKSVPEKGKANKELIDLLADYFKISKSQIEIIGGKTSSRKIIEING